MDLRFSNVFGAIEALVSNFKWFGGQPAGKEHSPRRENWGIDPWREPLKDGLSLNTSYLVHYLLTVDLRCRLSLLSTVDLRLETCLTIDSYLRIDTCFTIDFIL